MLSPLHPSIVVALITASLPFLLFGIISGPIKFKDFVVTERTLLQRIALCLIGLLFLAVAFDGSGGLEPEPKPIPGPSPTDRAEAAFREYKKLLSGFTITRNPGPCQPRIRASVSGKQFTFDPARFDFYQSKKSGHLYIWSNDFTTHTEESKTVFHPELEDAYADLQEACLAKSNL